MRRSLPARFELAVSLFREVRFVFGYSRVRSLGIAVWGFLWPHLYDGY